jgi:hypothetical protein
VSRQDRARAVLACLSRAMRPLSCLEIGRRTGLHWGLIHGATYCHPWFSRGDGVVWVTERGWRERLAGHPDLRGE